MRKVVKESKYILTLPLRGRGNIGDIIVVRPGYGRYLERYGKAERVTDEIINNLEVKKMQWQKQQADAAASGDKLLQSLKKISKVVLQKKTSQDVHLYAAIKKEDVIEALAKQGITVDKAQILMNSNIKKLGEYPIIINAYGDKDHSLILEIMDENAKEEKKSSKLD